MKIAEEIKSLLTFQQDLNQLDQILKGKAFASDLYFAYKSALELYNRFPHKKSAIEKRVSLARKLIKANHGGKNAG